MELHFDSGILLGRFLLNAARLSFDSSFPTSVGSKAVQGALVENVEGKGGETENTCNLWIGLGGLSLCQHMLPTAASASISLYCDVCALSVLSLCPTKQTLLLFCQWSSIQGFVFTLRVGNSLCSRLNMVILGRTSSLKYQNKRRLPDAFGEDKLGEIFRSFYLRRPQIFLAHAEVTLASCNGIPGFFRCMRLFQLCI